MTITRHAAQRWIERVDPSLDIIGAYAAIKKHEKIIKLGISLKATAVILGTGARLVLCGSYVVTVIGKD